MDPGLCCIILYYVVLCCIMLYYAVLCSSSFFLTSFGTILGTVWDHFVTICNNFGSPGVPWGPYEILIDFFAIFGYFLGPRNHVFITRRLCGIAFSQAPDFQSKNEAPIFMNFRLFHKKTLLFLTNINIP